MAVSLIRQVRFRATHHLAVPGANEAENRARLGAVSTPHSHDYVCEVRVTGPVNALGMVVDLGDLDRILDAEVVRRFNGTDLNRALPATDTELPTCETLARFLFGRIAALLPGPARLDSVRVAEDPSLAAECTGLD